MAKPKNVPANDTPAQGHNSNELTEGGENEDPFEDETLAAAE